jgi:hypothetical protein
MYCTHEQDFPGPSRVLRQPPFFSHKKYVVFTSAVLWGIWKLRNNLCSPNGMWKNTTVLWRQVAAMIRNWEILDPGRHLGHFRAVVLKMEAVLREPEKLTGQEVWPSDEHRHRPEISGLRCGCNKFCHCNRILSWLQCMMDWGCGSWTLKKDSSYPSQASCQHKERQFHHRFAIPLNTSINEGTQNLNSIKCAGTWNARKLLVIYKVPVISF